MTKRKLSQHRAYARGYAAAQRAAEDAGKANVWPSYTMYIRHIDCWRAYMGGWKDGRKDWERIQEYVA